MLKKLMIKTLQNEKTKKVPFWFMRQAGRYLPEYRALREKAGSFLNMAFNPDLASEITLQPIRRFGMDAAIIFSDILVIPYALGQKLDFVQGEGPKLEPINFEALNFDQFDTKLKPVYEALQKTKDSLNVEKFHDTALIGFAGSPWTVATYMIEGGGSKEFIRVKKFAYQKPQEFQKLIDILVKATSLYALNQIKSGAEIFQLFDSWAGILDYNQFENWVIKPNQAIINNIRAVYPDVPIIAFPKGIGANTQKFIQDVKPNALGLDQQFNPAWVAENLQPRIIVQGNLDPICLLAGGKLLENTAKHILDTLSHKPFIFNLGHGIHKDTPIDHVEKLIKIIKEY